MKKKQTFKLVSVSQLAKIKGQTPQAIRKAIRVGNIKATRIGMQWVVNINEQYETKRRNKKS